ENPCRLAAWFSYLLLYADLAAWCSGDLRCRPPPSLLHYAATWKPGGKVPEPQEQIAAITPVISGATYSFSYLYGLFYVFISCTVLFSFPLAVFPDHVNIQAIG